jgi:hypothetical protein
MACAFCGFVSRGLTIAVPCNAARSVEVDQAQDGTSVGAGRIDLRDTGFEAESAARGRALSGNGAQAAGGRKVSKTAYEYQRDAEHKEWP